MPPQFDELNPDGYFNDYSQFGPNYTMDAGTPTTPSTGTSLVQFWFKGTRSFGSTKISTIVRGGTGNYAFNYVATQTDIPPTLWAMGSHGGSGGAILAVKGSVPPTTSAVTLQCTDTGNIAVDATQYLAVYMCGVV